MKTVNIIFLAFLFVSNVLFGQNKAQVAIDAFVSNPNFSNASISFLAFDLTNNKSIAEYNPTISLPPASITKLFSTATALETMGADHQPFTRIYLEGELDSTGRLNGNIWVRGGGDPTLGSKYFNGVDQADNFLKIWVDTLLKLGIKTISGSVIADGSEFGYNGCPDGWSWSDMGNYYGAGASGIVLYDNTLQITFKTGSSVGSAAQLISVFPEVAGLQFHNYITSSSKEGDNSFIYGAPYSLDRFGTGTLPIKSAAFIVKGSMPDPEFQLAQSLQKAMIERGVICGLEARSVRKHELKFPLERYEKSYHLVYTHKGKSILEIVQQTNMKSVNLFAEELLSLVGYTAIGNGTTDSGLNQMEKYWASKVDISGLYIKDGSGLSRSNAISAKHFCNLLAEMSKSKNFEAFQSSLPIAGCSGTLKGVCKNQLSHGRMKAKSGSMNRIRSYAGYIDTTTGKKIAFAFIINNFNCSSSQVVDEMEKVFNVLSAF